MGNFPASYANEYSTLDDPFWNSLHFQPELLLDDNFVIEHYYRLVNKIETLPEDENANKSMLRFNFSSYCVV